MRRVLITGANRGIGLELTKIFSKDSQVIGVCRQNSSELKEVAHQVVSGIQLAEPESHLKVKDALMGHPLDVLIHNAGILEEDRWGEIRDDALVRQFEVNAIAPLLLTQSLNEHLVAGSKVALITSRMGSIEDNTSGGYYGYRASKAALNAIGKSLSNDLKSRGVSVILLHPGFVQTRMTGMRGDITPAEAAHRLKERIDSLTLEASGSFWHSNGESLPW